METTSHRVAQLIWRSLREGAVMAALPPDLAPATRAAGYAAQAALEALSGAPRAGWKIAATSAAGQAHIGVDGPLLGRLFAATLHPPGAAIDVATNRMRVVEPEFAFRFARPVPPRAAPYTAEEALAHVGDLHLALEIPDSRFADFATVGGPSLIADNACARELVVGPPVDADWRALDLAAHPVHAEVAGRYRREGRGANVLGDPRAALAWCVNELSALGLGLKAGELVTTGTCMPPLEVAPGDRVEVDYGALGRIGVAIAG